MTDPALRRASTFAGLLLLVQAIVLAIILAATQSQVLLPITALLSGGQDGSTERFVLARLDLGVGVVVLCVLVAVARLVTAVPKGMSLYGDALQSNGRAVRRIEFAFSSSITVLLVAELNGISDVGTLVLSYAITSGVTLFSVLQDRAPETTGRMLPLWFAAAIGIVPWGVIAYHQVGALIVGDPPSVMARVITLTMLVFYLAHFLSQWREQRVAATGALPAAERRYVLLSLGGTSVFAWLVVLGVVGATGGAGV
ncbi:MAG: heliorhodopsin HeR [Actinomycetota bacterium]